jgi:hypothetical protein
VQHVSFEPAVASSAKHATLDTLRVAVAWPNDRAATLVVFLPTALDSQAWPVALTNARLQRRPL